MKVAPWRRNCDTSKVLAVAVLGGAFAVQNRTDAQERGFTLFYALDMTTMIDWVYSINGGLRCVFP